MSLVFKDLNVEGFERVIEVTDASCGLHAIIAIHDTTLGPALGGIRLYPYTKFEDTLNDVKRLSRGMTHKAAMAGLGFGGGKSVIIVDQRNKTEALLRSFAQAVNRLDGVYICAQDYGCSMEDIEIIREETKYVVGCPHQNGSGDPSVFTAWGTIIGMKTALQELYGTDSFKGKVIAIQGVGSVGYKIAEHAFWLGAELIVADPSTHRVNAIAKAFDARVVDIDEILKVECDILAPCALGGILNAHTIPSLRCKAVVGCANNQLLEEKDATRLKDLDILYAPDFIVNAGGLINVSFELNALGYRPTDARNKLEQIEENLTNIYRIAKKLDCSTQAAVMALIEDRLKYKIGARKEPLYFHEMDGGILS